MFDACVTLGFIVLSLIAAYLAHRLIHGIRVYFRFRGTRLVTCPEAHQTAVVEVAARPMGIEEILDEPCLRVSECSRWPMREACGQDCLRQVESHSSELRFCAACKAS